VQIQSFVMSSDRQTDGDVLAMNGAAAALAFRICRFKGRWARCGSFDRRPVCAVSDA